MLLAASESLRNRGWIARADALGFAASPASLAISTIGLSVGLRMIYLDVGVRDFSNKVVALLLIVAITWGLYNLIALIDIVLRRRRTDPKLVATVTAPVRKALRIFLLVMVGLFIVQKISGAEITPWLAGLGSPAWLCRSRPRTRSRTSSARSRFSPRPFLVGDRVIFDDIDGTVEEIGFRSTRIRMLIGPPGHRAQHEVHRQHDREHLAQAVGPPDDEHHRHLRHAARQGDGRHRHRQGHSRRSGSEGGPEPARSAAARSCSTSSMPRA